MVIKVYKQQDEMTITSIRSVAMGEKVKGVSSLDFNTRLRIVGHDLLVYYLPHVSHGVLLCMVRKLG